MNNLVSIEAQFVFNTVFYRQYVGFFEVKSSTCRFSHIINKSDCTIQTLL